MDPQKLSKLSLVEQVAYHRERVATLSELLFSGRSVKYYRETPNGKLRVRFDG